MSRWYILLLLLVAACDRTRDVTVLVSVPGINGAGTPAAAFGFVVLPYDRDSLVSAFEARAKTPRPSTDALDTLFARYRAPFSAYTALVAQAGQLSDSMAALKLRLDSLPRTSPDYGAAYAKWTALRDTMRALDGEAASARAALEAARPAFIARSDSLRTVIRTWQDSTYQGYDSAVSALVRASHREPVADTTDATGRAVVQLRGGPWWVYARSWDPSDPNAEWYWNVPVDADTVRLDASTGINRPRY